MSQAEQEESEELEADCQESIEAALHSLGGDWLGVQVITMGVVKDETGLDPELSVVKQVLESGDTWPQELEQFRRVKASLSMSDGLVLYGDRIVIPASLRQQVLLLCIQATKELQV